MSELTKKALAVSLFYYHFKDIYDLLEWIYKNEVILFDQLFEYNKINDLYLYREDVKSEDLRITYLNTLHDINYKEPAPLSNIIINKGVIKWGD